MYFTATTVCKPTFLLEENIFSTEFRNAILKDYESINEHYLGVMQKQRKILRSGLWMVSFSLCSMGQISIFMVILGVLFVQMSLSPS